MKKLWFLIKEIEAGFVVSRNGMTDEDKYFPDREKLIEYLLTEIGMKEWSGKKFSEVQDAG